MRSSAAEPLVAEAPQVWTPDSDQRRGVKFLLEHGHAGLLADPGVGKTSIALQAFRLLRHEGLIDRMVVIAPLRPCYLVWPAEQRKWKQFNDLRIAMLHGPGREEALKDKKADVFVISNHHENLGWLFSFGRWRRLIDALLGIDESSKFKYMRTQRFSAIRPFLKHFRRRQIYTGSPASRNLLDLHGQMYLLDLGKTFTPHVSYYRNKWFAQTGFGGYNYVPREGAEEDIFERVAPYLLRLEDKGTGKPQLRINPVQIVLPAKARRAYDELEAQFFARIDDKEVTAFNAGALSTKCAQVASGGVFEDWEVDERTGLPKKHGKRRWLALHDEKTAAVTDLYEELQGQQLLIAYHWQHDLERLKRAFGKDLAVLGGGSIAQDRELERLWLAGRIPVMAGHPASVGHGLNLQTGGAHHLFWYTLTHDFELYDQFNRRIWRRGNPAKFVHIHHCVARDTVEEAKLLSLQAKDRGQRALFDALLAYRRRRR